jgi:ankyrin repeat protein
MIMEILEEYKALELYLATLSKDNIKKELLTCDAQALRSASDSGHANVVELLLKQGHVKEQLLARGAQALYWASRKRHAQVVKILKQYAKRAGCLGEMIRIIPRKDQTWNSIYNKENL